MFGNFYLANGTRYIDSGIISEQSKKDLFNLFNNRYQKSFDGLFVCLENFNLFNNRYQKSFDGLVVCLESLAMQPNPENLTVHPNHEKIFLSSIV